MNSGKKLIRNTVFGLWGTAALFIGLNRLNATPTSDGKGGSSFTLGLMQERRPGPDPEIDLANARDFSQLSVRGPFSVEVVGAGEYKVSLVAADGQALQVHAFLDQGVLRVDGGDVQGATEGAKRGVLRVEVPTLRRIDVSTSELTIRGLNAPELHLNTYRGGTIRLEQNQVQHWQVFSPDALELRMDDATFAAGTMKANGDVVIRRAP